MFVNYVENKKLWIMLKTKVDVNEKVNEKLNFHENG